MSKRDLLNWFLSPTFDRYNMSEYDIENVARMICNNPVEQGMFGGFGEFHHIYVCDPSAELYKESEFLKPVVEIYNILKIISPKYINHFLVHGSLADFNYIKGWSDLDTWVVIDDKIFNSIWELIKLKKLFSKLNKLLLKIDPIAHHGFIFVLESDLNNYSDALLPIDVIQSAINLYGPSEISICKCNIQTNWVKKFQDIKETFVNFELSGVFKHHPYKGKYLTKEMINKNEGMYQFKYLIGTPMILPSMYYTAIGNPVYKADSFVPFLQTFPEASIIKCVSQIRYSWESMEKYPYVPNNIPVWLLNMLPPDYVLQIIQLLDDILKSIKEYNHVSKK